MKVQLPNAVKQFVKDILTGIDGQSYDIARVTWFLGALFYMGLTAYEVIHEKKPFDYEQWSIGFGTMMAAGGVSVKLKETTEPQPPSSNN